MHILPHFVNFINRQGMSADGNGCRRGKHERRAETVSRPNESPGWTGETGRVEKIVPAQMDNFGLTPDNTTVYLCGNPDMITAVDEIATARGFPPEQIRKELYWPKGREHR